MTEPSNKEITERLEKAAGAFGAYGEDLRTLLRLAAERLEESLSPYCVCGQEHRPSDSAFEGGRPRKPGCRPLTWQEVAARQLWERTGHKVSWAAASEPAKEPCRNVAEAELLEILPAIYEQRDREWRERLPDPEKLRLLADWFDAQQPSRGWNGTEVQDDLRKWADNIAAFPEEK